jgi:hypothetical protein
VGNAFHRDVLLRRDDDAKGDDFRGFSPAGAKTGFSLPENLSPSILKSRRIFGYIRLFRKHYFFVICDFHAILLLWLLL